MSEPYNLTISDLFTQHSFHCEQTLTGNAGVLKNKTDSLTAVAHPGKTDITLKNALFSSKNTQPPTSEDALTD